MMSLLLKFKKVLLGLLVGALLLGSVIKTQGATEYCSYTVGENNIEQTIDENIPVWQVRKAQVVIRCGEFP